MLQMKFLNTSDAVPIVSDAVPIVSYLINRMPSTPLGGETPLRRLHPDMELFSLLPRVLGCVTFV